jgi:hypothetical protein
MKQDPRISPDLYPPPTRNLPLRIFAPPLLPFGSFGLGEIHGSIHETSARTPALSPFVPPPVPFDLPRSVSPVLAARRLPSASTLAGFLRVGRSLLA